MTHRPPTATVADRDDDAARRQLERAREGSQPELTLWDVLSLRADADAHRTAVVLPDRRVDFATLHRESAEVRMGLHRAGLRRGDHLALLGTNSIDWVVTFLGAVALGVRVVPVNTRLTDDEIRWTVEASRSRMVVVQPSYGRRSLGTLVKALDRAPSVERVFVMNGGQAGFSPVPRAPGQPPPPEAASPDDVAVIMYTSGTTAKPKGCMLDHCGIVRNACLHTDRLRLVSDDRWFSGMPLFHAGGLIWGLTSVLVTGACLVTQTIFDAGQALDLIEAESCTYQHGVDTMFIREMDHPAFRPERVASLRKAASTGPPEILRRIHDEMGVDGIVSKWGISEGYGNLTLCSPDDPLSKRLDSVGRGYPGIEYRIADAADGGDLPAGEVGEICVRGSAMVGFYDEPELTARMFDPDGWLHTGDLGRFDAEGYLYFMGRLKEMVKVGGENVSAAEVENVIVRHPSVSSAYVVGCAHGDLGEVPVAFVVPADGCVLDEATLDEHCRQQLAPFKVPARYVATSEAELQMTASMKIVKRGLEERAKELFGVLG